MQRRITRQLLHTSLPSNTDLLSRRPVSAPFQALRAAYDPSTQTDQNKHQTINSI